MVHDRTEYMVGGTQAVAIESDSISTCGLGSFSQARRFFNYGTNLRKNLKFVPKPIVEVRIRVSRVKMNAKVRRP
jgi:hypothetical protein